jgi:hypothetical protein
MTIIVINRKCSEPGPVILLRRNFSELPQGFRTSTGENPVLLPRQKFAKCGSDPTIEKIFAVSGQQQFRLKSLIWGKLVISASRAAKKSLPSVFWR